MKKILYITLLLPVLITSAYGMGWRGVNAQKGATAYPAPTQVTAPQTAQPKSPAAPVAPVAKAATQPQYYKCQGNQCAKITAAAAAQPKSPAAAPVYKCVGGNCKKQQPAAAGPMYGKMTCKGGVCKLAPRKK